MRKHGGARQPSKRNATSWRKGQSGNLRGSPGAGKTCAEAVRGLLLETDRASGKTNARRVAEAHLRIAARAKNPSVSAARWLFDVAIPGELEERIVAIEERLVALREGRRADVESGGTTATAGSGDGSGGGSGGAG